MMRRARTQVSIVTPTIRRGFWNIMAHNIAGQTHRDLEWLVIDDHPRDRSEIAREYADRYGLDVRYHRGKKRRVERRYALVNANNTVLEVASGELWIWLQDFILMPRDGVAKAVELYRENPRALLAFLDRYFHPRIPPDVESEDWFHGELDVIGELQWTSVRFSNRGIYRSQDPFRYEANYCAIPAAVASDLNGWWEFMDDGIGFDNTDIAFRALLQGNDLIVDETNVCHCINHGDALRGTWENIADREHNLNDPRYAFLTHMTWTGCLPVVRDEALDEQIRLEFTIPKEVDANAAIPYMLSVQDELISRWVKEYQGKLPRVAAREDQRRRLSFVWDFGVSAVEAYGWEDGLRAALDELSRKHGWLVEIIATDDRQQIWDRIEAQTPDAILCWGSLDRPSFAEMRRFGVPVALCFAGGPTEHPHSVSFDLIFVENELYVGRFREQGIEVVKAFGTHEILFRPMALSKSWGAIYPAPFCGPKRHHLFARAAGEQGLAVGGISYGEPQCHEICVQQGVTVIPRVPYRVLPHLYNQARTAVITALEGSQRAVLEAMACNVWPIVMSDNAGCRELVEESGYGSIVEPRVEEIRTEWERVLADEPRPIGRNHILENYRAERYADLLQEGLARLVGGPG